MNVAVEAASESKGQLYTGGSELLTLDALMDMQENINGNFLMEDRGDDRCVVLRRHEELGYDVARRWKWDERSWEEMRGILVRAQFEEGGTNQR